MKKYLNVSFPRKNKLSYFRLHAKKNSSEYTLQSEHNNICVCLHIAHCINMVIYNGLPLLYNVIYLDYMTFVRMNICNDLNNIS